MPGVAANETCRRLGHDYGNGTEAVNTLREGERQTCVNCGITRELSNGTLYYRGRVNVVIREEKDNG